LRHELALYFAIFMAAQFFHQGARVTLQSPARGFSARLLEAKWQAYAI
jgi:hypothetical protein